MRKLSAIIRRVEIFLRFPHIWTCIIILLISTVDLLISYWLNTHGESYWSSIFANLFAGFVTGFVICLISSVKQIHIIKMQEKRIWLTHLLEMILEYNSIHRKLLHLHFDKFDRNKEAFDLIYDAGSHANWINDEILQSSLSKTLSFNTIRYCKKQFGYDAVALCKEFEDLHETLNALDIDCPGSKAILKSFETIDRLLWNLGSEVRKAIDDLDIRLSEIQKSII